MFDKGDMIKKELEKRNDPYHVNVPDLMHQLPPNIDIGFVKHYLIANGYKQKELGKNTFYKETSAT